MLQLKSAQDPAALDNISRIIKVIYDEYGYLIRGHEIHQLSGLMRKTSLAERVEMVSRFCTKNEMECLTYHAPILGAGDNIWDDKRREKVKESIRVTAREAEAVCKEAGLQKPIVVFHLTSYVPLQELPATWEEKSGLLERAGQEFLAFHKEELENSCTFAVENTYPRYKADSANTGPFHPLELVRLAKHGVATTLDLAHYQLYSNYVKYGQGNLVGDLDRRHYGLAPGWLECVEILGDSLVQLHISDARGMDIQGEALPLGEGEIPVAKVLEIINSAGRTVRGTLELGGGHLDGARLQLEGARWLLKNVPKVFEK
ncbi:MAG: hypothetical protein ACREAY_11055 [Nitrososphaera sp.]